MVANIQSSSASFGVNVVIGYLHYVVAIFFICLLAVVMANNNNTRRNNTNNAVSENAAAAEDDDEAYADDGSDVFFCKGFVRKLYVTVPSSSFHCSSCYKEEPVGQQFPECNGCGEAFYCSRECQKHDWKKHKPICKSIQNTSNRQRKYKKLNRRLDKFTNIYFPLIRPMAIARFALHYQTTGEDFTVTSPITHGVVVFLTDLPDSAMRPRLCIEKLSVSKMSQPMKSIYRKSDAVEELQMPLFIFVPYEGQYIQVGHSIIITKTFPPLRYSMPRENLLKDVTKFLRTINGIAKGELPDHWKCIERRLEANHDAEIEEID